MKQAYTNGYNPAVGQRTSRDPATRAVLIACVGTGSFVGWLLSLRLLHNLSFSTVPPKVPQEAYILPTVAFATAFLHNFVYLLFEKKSVKKELGVLVCYVNWTAGLFEALCWLGYLPAWQTSDGRPFMVARYVMWGHATPVMLYVMSMMSDVTQTEVGWTVMADVLMVVLAPMGDLATGVVKHACYVLSFLMFPYLIVQLWRFFESAAQASHDEGTQRALRGLRNVTIAFWCMFPIIWCFVQAGVDFVVEEMLWGLADFCGKVLFSCSLLHSNFMTIEQRRLTTMRVVEEGNRIKVIQELKELVEQKQQFIALMSHELRTPLNGIIGLSENLLSECSDVDGKASGTLTAIQNSGKRLLHVINDILEAATCYKGELVVNIEKVKLHTLTDDVTELVRPLLKPGVQLINNVASKHFLVAADSTRLVQILYNLLGNAAKFTELGSVTVDARYIDHDTLVEVAVHDTGIGIPKDKLSSVFSSFRQIDHVLSRRHAGTGLGLSVVRQLVEAHGGTIRAESDPPKGSSFIFTLQAWKGKSNHSPTNRSPRSSLDIHQSSIRTSQSFETQVRESSTIAAVFQKRKKDIAEEIHQMNNPPGPLLYTPRASIETCTSNGRGGGVEGKLRIQGETSRTDLVRAGRVLEAAEPTCSTRSVGMPTNGKPRSSGSGPFQLSDEVQKAVNDFVSSSRAQVESVQEASRKTRLGDRPPQRTTGKPPSLYRGTPAPTSPPNSDSHKHNSNSNASSNAHSAAAQESRGAPFSAIPPVINPPESTPSISARNGFSVSGHNGIRSTSLPPTCSTTGDLLPPASKQNTTKVLSVDDDPVNQLVMRKFLQRGGYLVEQAKSGFQALDLLFKNGYTPDIILLDVMMPGMSGFEVCRRVRQKYTPEELPVIMVSAHSREEYLMEGKDAGSNDYISKPFSYTDLLVRIEAQLHIRDSLEEQQPEANGSSSSGLHPGSGQDLSVKS